MNHLSRVLFFLLAGMMTLYAQPANLPTSLHGTRQGKATFYYGTQEEPGAFDMIGVEIAELGCQNCHPGNFTYQNGETFTEETYNKLSCNNCHDANFQVAQPDACKACHGRISKQEQLGITDIHQTQYGMKCTNCHKTGDIHGDGHSYTNMFDEADLGNGQYDYPIDADCSDCHSGDNAPPANAAHNQHGEDIHCSTCHTGQVISCYNCHFNQQIDRHQKIPYGVLKGFTIIAHRTGSKYNGKIWPVSFQSLYYKTPEGKDTTFVTFVPYYSHNVLPKEQAKTCSDCHNNANVQEYNTNGVLYIAKWNNETNKIEGITGIVPMPENYKDVFKMDFVVQDTATKIWSPVGEDTPDRIQNLGYVAPLAADEMAKLATPQGIEDGASIIKGYELHQNYPNPFNPTTTISFHIPWKTTVTLKVYDVTGKEVATLISGETMGAGSYQVVFDGANLSSGIYFYKLTANSVTMTRKMVLVK